MQKLTIGLVLIIILLLGIIGFIFASMGSQSIPNIALSNNSTNDSGQSNSDLIKTTKTNPTKKTNSRPTNSTGNSTGNSTKKNTTNDPIKENWF